MARSDAKYTSVTIKSDVEVQEAKATAVAITPGHLIERTSGDLVQKHGTAGGNAVPTFAIEDEWQGEEVTHAYDASGRIFFKFFRPGDRCVGRLANGQNVAIGEKLVSNGDGTLKKYTAAASAAVIVEPEEIVAVAREAVDLSSSDTADPSEQIDIEIFG